MCHALILAVLIATNGGNGRAPDTACNNLLAMRVESIALNNLVGPDSGGCRSCVRGPSEAARTRAAAGGTHGSRSHDPRWDVVGRVRRAWTQRRRRLLFRLPRTCRQLGCGRFDGRGTLFAR